MERLGIVGGVANVFHLRIVHSARLTLASRQLLSRL